MKRIIDDITNFIFIRDEPEKSDIIFIPGGSSPETAENAAKLYEEGMAPYIMPSGKYGVKNGKFVGVKTRKDKYNETYSTECEFLTDVLIKNGVPQKNILKESESTYTQENAFFSRKITDSKGMQIKKAILCCKSYHARRAMIYYQIAFPETEFFVVPSDVSGISKENWYGGEYAFDKVMSELGKCGTQLAADVKNLLKVVSPELFDVYDQNGIKQGKPFQEDSL